MAVVVPAPPHSDAQPLMRRRTSTSILKFSNHPSTIFLPSDDLELMPIKSNNHRYSSLRDLLPVNSPKNKPAMAGSDICIRNRLVKQAARAYLRPMSSASVDPRRRFLWARVAGFVEFCFRNVVRALKTCGVVLNNNN